MRKGQNSDKIYANWKIKLAIKDSHTSHVDYNTFAILKIIFHFLIKYKMKI